MTAADIVVAANIPIIIVDTRNVPQGVMPDTAHVQHQSIMVSCQGCRLIDIRPTKSLGLILGLMHQIKLKINIHV